MVDLMLDDDECKIVGIFNPNDEEYQIPDALPVDFILKNKLCLSLYNNIGTELESKFSSDELDRIWRKARYMESTIDELHIISKAFEENGIDYLYLFKAIESQCDSTDVDIVLGDGDFEETGKVLEQLGYFAPLFPYEDEHYVKSEGGNVVQMDFGIEKENIHGYYPFDEKKVKLLSNRRKVNGLYVPSIEDDLIICITRTIDKNEIPIKTLLHISNLLKNCSDVNAVKNRLKKGWYTPLLHSIYIINILHKNLFGTEIESPFIPIAKKAHAESKMLTLLTKYETKKLSFPFDSKIFLLYWDACKLINNIRYHDFKAIAKSVFVHFPPIIDRIKLVSCARKRNLLVSFSGIDGTGKSTNSKKLVRRFKDMRIPSQFAECLWSPRISYPFMAIIYLLTGWRRKDYHKSKILRKTWNYIVIFDFIFIYLFRIKRHLIIGKTVFADKYAYDLLTTLMYNDLYNEKASKIMLKLLPRPDLVFIFDIPDEVSNERKDDTIEYVKKFGSDQDVNKYLGIRREGYIKIANSLNVPIIDSTRDFDEIHEEIFRSIIGAYKNK